MQNKNLIHNSFNNAIYEYEEILRRARTMETNLDVIRRYDRTPQALLEPITVTIDTDGSAFVEYEAAIVLSPEAVREISDIIYLHSEQRDLNDEQE